MSAGKGNAQGWGKWELGGGRPGRPSAGCLAGSHRCPKRGAGEDRALGPGAEPARPLGPQ